MNSKPRLTPEKDPQTFKVGKQDGSKKVPSICTSLCFYIKYFDSNNLMTIGKDLWTKSWDRKYQTLKSKQRLPFARSIKLNQLYDCECYRFKRLLNNEITFSNRLTEQTLFINNIYNIKKYFQKECLD